MLAVVFFANQFRPYLLGKHFKLRTDHGVLTWLMSFTEPERQMAKWLEKLQEHDFEIKHRLGRKHTNADALSRLPCKQCSYQPGHPTDQLTVSAISLQVGKSTTDLHQIQMEDPVIHSVLVSKNSGVKPTTDQFKQYSPHTSHLLALWDQLVLKDNVLYQHFISADGSQDHLQLAVPKSLLLGPLPKSETGNSYLLVAGDYFTRWMEVYPFQTWKQLLLPKS